METLSASRNILRTVKQVTRRAGNAKEQGDFSTDPVTANGFLRHQFLPLYEPSAHTPDQGATEQPFFDCLNVLTGACGFKNPDLSDKAYPYNVLLAYDRVEKQLRAMGDTKLSIMQDDAGKLQLETTHSFSTGRTLYFIPVMPLYRLMQDEAQKQTADLLLSIFSYLYHVAGLPFYTEESSDIYRYYESIMEWEEDDMDEEQNDSLTKEALQYGEIVLEQVYDLRQLHALKARIDAFEPSNYVNWSCLNIANKTLELYKEYPNKNIFRNMSCPEPEDEDDRIIVATEYISFVADTRGALFEQISQMVNDEFNECSEMEQPFLTEVFDTENTPEAKGLDFEHRLFALLSDLCTLLDELP